MERKELAKIKRRVKTLHRQLGKLGPIMRGSVVALGANKQIRFSVNKNKKTQMIYLGRKREEKAKKWSENYKKLKEIVDEMTDLNMILIKNDYAEEA